MMLRMGEEWRARSQGKVESGNGVILNPGIGEGGITSTRPLPWVGPDVGVGLWAGLVSRPVWHLGC